MFLKIQNLHWVEVACQLFIIPGDMKKRLSEQFIDIACNLLLQLRRIVIKAEHRIKLVFIIKLNNVSCNCLHATTTCSSLLEDLNTGYAVGSSKFKIVVTTYKCSHTNFVSLVNTYNV